MVRTVLTGTAVGVVVSGLVVAVVVPTAPAAWHTSVAVWGITAAVVALSVLAVGHFGRRE